MHARACTHTHTHALIMCLSYVMHNFSGLLCSRKFSPDMATGIFDFCCILDTEDEALLSEMIRTGGDFSRKIFTGSVQKTPFSDDYSPEGNF